MAHPSLAYYFRSGTRCHIIATSVTLSRPNARKVLFMEPNQQVENETQLVTETLVEEVSIDGMCGVY
jgi:mycofactocin precursor